MRNLDRKTFLKSITGLVGLSLLPSGLVSHPSPLISATDALKVVHLTDVHMEDNPVAEKALVSCLNSISVLNLDFIINGGDSIMNAALTFSKSKVDGQWRLFNKIIEQNNKHKVYHCIGNHDLYGGWPLSSKKHEAENKLKAMDEYKIQSPYYSVTHGCWKFVVLDSIRMTSSVPGYYAKLDDEQFHWLDGELKSAQNEGLFVCVTSHAPILSVCAVFDGELIKTGRTHDDGADLAKLFHRYGNVRACLSGHMHMVDHVNYLGVDYFCNGAVCGGWWKGSHHEFPPAYCVMSFGSDGTVTREVKYYRWQ